MGDWDDLDLGTGEIPDSWFKETLHTYTRYNEVFFENPRMLFLSFQDALSFYRMKNSDYYKYMCVNWQDPDYWCDFINDDDFDYSIYNKFVRTEKMIIRRYNGKYNDLKQKKKNYLLLLMKEIKTQMICTYI